MFPLIDLFSPIHLSSWATKDLKTMCDADVQEQYVYGRRILERAMDYGKLASRWNGGQEPDLESWGWVWFGMVYR